MGTLHGINTAEAEALAQLRRAEVEYWCWIVGTLGFTAVEVVLSRGRTTFSTATRRTLRLHHPAGRALLAAAEVVLYVHLTDKRKRAEQALHRRRVR